MAKPAKCAPAAVLSGIVAACNVALAAFDAAPDGSGDVDKNDARRIKRALEWALRQTDR